MKITRLRMSSRSAVVALCLGAMPLPSGIARGQSVRDAIKYGESVVCLNGEGRFLAWDNRSFEFKQEFSAELSKATFTRIASNGNRIWGVREQKLLEWLPGTKTWEAVARFDAGGEKLAGIAVVGETPVLIFPTKVMSPVEDRVFEVPRLQGNGLLPISWSRDNGSQGCGCSSDWVAGELSSIGTYLSNWAAYFRRCLVSQGTVRAFGIVLSLLVLLR